MFATVPYWFKVHNDSRFFFHLDKYQKVTAILVDLWSWKF